VTKGRATLALLAAGFCALGLPAHADSPANAAMVAKVTPALERYVGELLQREEIPGVAIVIADRHRVLYAKGFGVREAGKPAPVTPGTVFQIGSVTKSFLATTVALAVDEGRLAWDTPIAQSQPGFALQDAWVTQHATPADVLSHTVGLPSYVYDDMIFLGYGMPSRLKAVAQAPLTGRFRQGAQYVNLLHPLVGDMAAKATGNADWNALLTQRIFGPLQMASSSATREGLLNAADHASPHQHNQGALQVIPAVGRYWYGEGVGPAGSINSTAQDMGQWIRLQLGRGEVGGKRIVSEANMAETWRPRVMMSPTEGSAPGWGVRFTPQGRMISHDGGTASYGANVMLLPEAGEPGGGGLGIAVLSNHGQEGAPFAISRWFAERLWGLPVFDHRAGFKRPAQPAATAASSPALQRAQDYTGVYQSPTLGSVTVRQDGEGASGQLLLQLEEVGATLRLVPLDPLEGDTFSAEVLPQGRFEELVAEGFTPIYQVAFRRSSNGKAESAQATSPLASRHELVRLPDR
jgi:CubicO group peptidase (beta-lactamase class C family)